MRLREQFLIALPVVLAFGLVGWLMWPASSALLLYGSVTAIIAVMAVMAGSVCFKAFWRAPSWRARVPGAVGIVGVFVFVGLYVAGLVWKIQPGWLPVRGWYDFIENREVTLRLVDPNLVKVEEWEIVGDTRTVLFLHPSLSGSTTLVYPVMVRPRTVLSTALALAPGAWSGEGDGVVFEVYVEDDSGIHLLFSRYVDPKHHQQDRRWVPVLLDLSGYAGKLVRVIFSVNGGPASDIRYDWSGWAEPRLVEPLWPW